MADSPVKVPMGVRIYEFIHGRDFPFKPGTTDPIRDKSAPSTVDAVRAKTETIGERRAAAIEDAEEKALRPVKTDYATGGVVRSAHAMHRGGAGSVPYPMAGNASQPTPDDPAANRMSRQGERANTMIRGGTHFARGGLVQAMHQARSMRRAYAKGGPVVGDAAGGPVIGPGTGTSDSVPINASNGEFVIPAKTTEFFGPEFFQFLIEYSNKMMQDEAKGGGEAEQQAFYSDVADEVR
jgi:hypothetical protein